MLLWALVALFAVSEIALAISRRADPESAHVQDEGSMRLLWTVISVSWFAGAALAFIPHTRLPRAPALHRTIALALLAGGLTLRWLAILWLGRLFTVDVTISKEHVMVESGPYRWLRHPSYTGLLLAFAGIAALMWNWLSMVAILVPIWLALAVRIRREEDALGSQFGAAYRAYCERTWRLVPWVY